MKKIFYCVHHITVDKGEYLETVSSCSSKGIAKKVAKSYAGGKTYISVEEKQIAE